MKYCDRNLYGFSFSGVGSPSWIDDYFQLSYPKKSFCMDDIISVDFYEKNKTTKVTFKDGTVVKVTAQGDDVFTKESGIDKCIIKYLCGNNGSFNNIYKKWIEDVEKKALENKLLAEKKAAEEKLRVERLNKARVHAKKLEAAKREEQIQIQAEAIVRANEMMKQNESVLI